MSLKKYGYFLLTLIATTAMLLGTNLPGDSRLVYSLQDSGHFLIFMILTLIALWTFRRMQKQPVWLIMSLVLLFGILIEAVQSRIGREASLYDLSMDLLGIAAGGVLHAGFVKRSFSPYLSIAILLALTLTAFSVPLHWFIAYQVRAVQFPRLIDPDNIFSRALIEGSAGGQVRHINLPEDWLLPVDLNADSCAYVSMPHGRWPGMDMQEPEADWSGYQSLEISIYSDQPKDLPLFLRVHDQSHNRQFEDRYNRRLPVHPGYNHFSLPLREIAHGPKTRTMDMSAISDVMIFSSQEHAGKGFCLIAMELR